MPCDRISAIRRLINLYIDAVGADPDYHRRVKIADVLTEQAISMVQSLDLHPEMDGLPAATMHSVDRDLQMLIAWLSAAPMGRLH
jgi:hypothetical protein